MYKTVTVCSLISDSLLLERERAERYKLVSVTYFQIGNLVRVYSLLLVAQDDIFTPTVYVYQWVSGHNPFLKKKEIRRVFKVVNQMEYEIGDLFVSG